MSVQMLDRYHHGREYKYTGSERKKNRGSKGTTIALAVAEEEARGEGREEAIMSQVGLPSKIKM